MNKESFIPKLGFSLREAIRAIGYRGYLVEKGLDKDLDDIAAEARTSRIFELLECIEQKCIEKLRVDCGNQWADLLHTFWVKYQSHIQELVNGIDTTFLSKDEGNKLILEYFIIPFLADALQRCFKSFSAPNIDMWLQSPFSSWLDFMSRKIGVAKQKAQENILRATEIDLRTIQRWIEGKPIGKFNINYIKRELKTQADEDTINAIVGWFLIVVAYQSLSIEVQQSIHDAVKSKIRVNNIDVVLYKIDDAINKISYTGLSICAINKLRFILQRDSYSVETVNELDSMKWLVEYAPKNIQERYHYIYKYVLARISVVEQDTKKALSLYEQLVDQAWWRLAEIQQEILSEALCYAVGVGDKVAAEKYWDMSFLLGLYNPPKRTLDDNEIRRLSFGFENKFHPLQAKHRTPPPVRGVLSDSFKVTAEYLKAPNRKIKLDDGKIRSTPLMEAINFGTLTDVKKLIEAGGDPNDFIPESGEGPLMYAMRRACDRKEPTIMNFLLTKRLSKETVNRLASSARETPLKYAIEMGNANVVDLLIKLGADIEVACDRMVSALCFTICLIADIPRYEKDSLASLLSWAKYANADAQDAKKGYVFDKDKLGRVSSMLTYINSNDERIKHVMDACSKYFFPSIEDLLKIVQVLLNNGADANRRYKSDFDTNMWTPTLYAAELGNLELFKILVEHIGPNKGDPSISLVPPTPFECYNAMWVAISNNNNNIISYLQENKHLFQPV